MQENTKGTHLFLAESLGTGVSLLGTGITKSPVRLELALLGGDLTRLLELNGRGQRNRQSRRLSLELLSGRITLLGFPSLLGVNDQSLLVRLESLHIHSLTLLAQIPPAMVDDDTESTSGFTGDTGFFEFGEGESAALSDFRVVAEGLASDCGAEGLEGTDAEGGCFCDTGCATAEFTAWLVEPGANSALPVLAEVVTVEDCSQDLVQTLRLFN